jgi:MFS superfamily sulfate permease-like transporter
MIAGGSMSASAVKEGAGARTQVSNLVTWVATLITLLFLTPLFGPLPEAVLAALIIHAVWHIISSRKLLRLRREAPVEVWFGVLAMAGVLLVDVLEGMIIGLVASLAFVIYRSSKPHISSLGRLPGDPGAYGDLARHPEGTPLPGVLIVRPDAPIYYANALTFRDRVNAMLRATDPPPRSLILDCSAQDGLDLTTTDMLKGLAKQLDEQGIEMVFADVHAPVLEGARASGVFGAAIDDRVFRTVDAAVRNVVSDIHGMQDPHASAGYPPASRPAP